MIGRTVISKRNADTYNFIAPAYDTINDICSLGFHRYWRAQLCREISAHTPKSGSFLDIATGTGDVVFCLLKMRPDIAFSAVDISHKMLSIAEKKRQKKFPLFHKQINFLLADGRSLPFPDKSFHTISIAWGLRNLQPLSLICKEILRVLKPGGHCFIVERSKVTIDVQEEISRFYSKASAFLTRKLRTDTLRLQGAVTPTLECFPYGREIVAEFFDNGFINVKAQVLLGGVVYLYSLTKPQDTL